MENYIERIAEITGEDRERIKAKMDAVEQAYAITHKEYFDNELYLLTEGKLALRAARLQRRKENRQNAFLHIEQETGWTRKEIIGEIKKINQKGIKKITLFFYEKFELYRLTEEETEAVLHRLNKRDALRDELLEAFKYVDRGEKAYTELTERVNALYQTVEQLMTDTFRKRAATFLVHKRKDIHDEAEIPARVFVDMEVTRLLLGFSFGEYVSFRFDEKTLEEKRTYISNKERMEVLSLLNEEDSCELLTNKVKCYRLLEKYFHRKQVYVESMADYPQFAEFCSGLDAFVKKSVALSMGKGVRLIPLTPATDLKALMNTLLDEGGSFAGEELICTHRRMKKMNPASVNTVRLETFFDGEKTVWGDAFMRFGQGGNFIDNAGAGGIFVAVDPRTGVVTSDGFDESGNIYLTHPDTGYAFRGYRLPAWRKALRLCEEISGKVPGIRFIGWDLTYTKDRKWVIVEGNAKPQIICNQTSQGKGLRGAFLDRVAVNGHEPK